MSINLLQLLGKFMTLLSVSVISVFNIGNYNETNVEKTNSLLEVQHSVVKSIDYDTVVQYNEKIPSNVTNVIKEGNIGLSLEENNKETTVKAASSEIVEQGTGKYGVYNGRLVGYGPDCKGCSGEGNLACKTKAGQKFSLKKDGIYYTDEQFGKIRILASDLTKFPCGTIIEVDKNNGTKFLAVVMDRIATKMENGELMDLAYESQEDKTVFAVDGLVGPNITYRVQRWGW